MKGTSMPSDIHTTDIVVRLRQAAKDRMLPVGISLMEIPKVMPGAIESEAASEIERLRVRITELEERCDVTETEARILRDD